LYILLYYHPLTVIGWNVGSSSEITGSKSYSNGTRILAVRLLLLGTMADKRN
jgi:hypothetical protein